MNRASTLALSCFVLIACAACAPPWTVVRQSGPPSALRGAQSVGIYFDYSQVMIDGHPEQTFLANNDDVDAQAKLQGVKDAFEAGVMEGALGSVPVQVGKQLQGADVAVTVRVDSLVRGKYAVIYRRDTEAHVSMLWTRGDALTDEIQTNAYAQASIQQPSIVQRAQIAGREIGRILGQFYRHAQEN